MNSTKFTEEEMVEIKTIQDKYSALGVQLVQLKLARKSSEDYLKLLESEEQTIEGEIAQTNMKEKELADSLNEKYGIGSLNMETGEFTPNK
jgi:ubiquinone/menaquinone biosynthesis C-methylase UbiE|tara:strand:- start:343 stop:615 length:273 start_codon:yes stop_codon:yes gene_type:complete